MKTTAGAHSGPSSESERVSEPATTAGLARTRVRQHRDPSEHETTLPAFDDTPDLRQYISTIIDSWALILKLLLVGAVAGVAFLVLKTPIYESDGMVQAEDKQKGIAGLEDLSEMVATQNLADTEIEIIRSRSLLGSVVDELGLDVSANPHYFPLFGKAVARWRHLSDPGSAPLGATRYAWGGERISVVQLEVPDEWVGKTLTLVATDPSSYVVFSPNELFGPKPLKIATGRVGEPAERLPGTSTAFKLTVTDLVARPGTEFTLQRQHRLAAIEDLRDRLLVAEKGKKTGVIGLTLQGERPAHLAEIVNVAEKQYVKQNIERKSAEAQQQLDFIETQLPDVKAKLEAAEAALNAYRTKVGSVDISIEAKAALDAAGEVEKNLTLLRLNIDEARAKYTNDHPVVQALREQQQHLERQRNSLEGRFRALPENELESTRLLRDVSVANELYVLLLNKAQDLKVLKSGTIGTVRIVDPASVPIKPISPKLGLTAIASLLGGFVLGVGLAFLRKSLDVGMKDPDALEASLKLPVFASIPHSDSPHAGTRRRRKGGQPVAALAVKDPRDLAVEAIRSMRTSLEFALREAPNTVVAITGPSPDIGKSFVAVNLAHILATTGKRVLLIDTDLRKGRLHEYFDGNSRLDGVAEVIAGKAEVKSNIRETAEPNLHFLATGALPANPAELLAGERYVKMIEEASRAYDVVVLDTAPILAVTDGALASRVASTTFLVLRAGKHPLREIKASLRRLDQSDVPVTALILNDVQSRSRYAYGSYGYHYQYDYR